MKQRIFAVFLAMIMLFGISACSTDGGSHSSQNSLRSDSISTGTQIVSDLSVSGTSDGSALPDTDAGTVSDGLTDSLQGEVDPEDTGSSFDDGSSLSGFEEEEPPATPDSVYTPPSSAVNPTPSEPSAPTIPGTSSESSAPTTPENSSTPSGSTTPWTPVNKVQDLVIATDQYHERIVVYDMSKISLGDSLDDAEVWSYKSGYAAGVKYREDTVFGDVVIIAGSTSAIVSYPAGKALWSTRNSGHNPHSIEILPSGNVVIANSTGGTLRMFFSGVSGKTSTYREYSLTGAHGVLWDPQRKLLWAVGDYELVSYTVSGSGAGEILTVKNRYPLPYTGGHDLAADFLDSDYLFITVNACVYRFNKNNGGFSTTFPASGEVDCYAVKGVGNNLNGNYFYCYPNQGVGRVWANMNIADWCTDTINFVRQTGWNTYSLERYKASASAFYKVRVFYGKYQ